MAGLSTPRILRTSLPLGVALAACSALLSHACSTTDETTTTPDADLLDAGRRDGRPTNDASDEPFVPEPDGAVPEGWKLYTDYHAPCGLYVPSEPKYLPPPVTWEPCSTLYGDAGGPLPASMDCRRMASNWEGDALGYHTNGWMRATRADDGKLRLLLRRFVKSALYDLVVDEDGAVQTALLQTGACITLRPDIGPTRVLYRIVDDRNGDSLAAGGALGAAHPQLLPEPLLPFGHQPSPVFSATYAAGRDLFVENIGSLNLYPFDGGPSLANLTAQPGDEGLAYVWPQFVNDDLFFRASATRTVTVKVWDATNGLRTLIGDPADPTKANSSFGTDGVDMVWNASSGRVDLSKIEYPINEIWTAKYSTDPAVVAATKRRVRSFEHYKVLPFVVGCGHAAIPFHVIGSPWGQDGVRVVRLSDGRAWNIMASSKEQSPTLHIYQGLALTCTELFAIGSRIGDYELVRIRLDSLGEGIPAD